MIDLGHKNVIDVVKYRFVWLFVSALLILPGVGAMIYSSMHSENHMPLKIGIDFTGGTITQYTTAQKIETNEIGTIRENLEKAGITNPQIQIINANSSEMVSTKKADEKKVEENKAEEDKKVEETSNYTGDINYIISIRSKFIDETNSEMYSKMTEAVKLTAPDATIEQVSSVGPTLGTELFQKSMWAMFWVFAAIIAYIAVRFKLDYSIIAVISLLHDVLFIVGVFSILGLVFGTEVDSLFITALLTVVGFSNHDTIVVFDRIRENMRFLAKKYSHKTKND